MEREGIVEENQWKAENEDIVTETESGRGKRGYGSRSCFSFERKENNEGHEEEGREL